MASQYNNTLVPETFIQITYHAADDSAQTDAIASSGSQTVFSNAASITDLDISVSGNYATAETNFGFWMEVLVSFRILNRIKNVAM